MAYRSIYKLTINTLCLFKKFLILNEKMSAVILRKCHILFILFVN